MYVDRKRGNGMAGFLDKIKGAFGGKKGSKAQADDPMSLYQKYGVREEDFQVNPLFEQDSENEAYNPLFGMDLEEEQDFSEEPLQEGNLIENIGGLPTIASIEKMTGGLKWDKIGKHKNFALALDALDKYQEIMQKQRKVTMNMTKSRRTRTTDEGSDLNIDGNEVTDAFEAMRTFVISAEKAVKGAQGLFAKRSSNVQKLTPIFANLLVQSYGLLPKLANLQYEISTYVIETDQETFTYSDIMNHQVVAGRSGGLAMRGTEENNGAVTLNPEEALQVLDYENAMGYISELRQRDTEKARMGLKIPQLPVGLLKAQKLETVGEDGARALRENAASMAENYIADLKILMRALDDTAESFAGRDANARAAVHEKQAEYFRVSKLLYQGIQNKELLIDVIINGLPEKLETKYQELVKLHMLGGATLADAVDAINKDAQDPRYFRKLEDKEGNALAKEDYIITGGAASIALIDKVNEHVLRSPMRLDDNNNKVFAEQSEQQTMLNGINDEAVGKITRFLGFNVAAQAEAVGFMAKTDSESEVTPVFGGSVMEKVKGVTAESINYTWGDQAAGIDGQPTVNILKQGRLLSDMMKMFVVDYIVMHGDRNAGNFMINLEAAENESMVTTIDNDMIFGDDSAGKRIGYENPHEALLGINDRAFMDFGNKLTTMFPMMTREVKDAIERIDLEEFNEMLMPYVDRVARRAAIHRAKELKELAKKVPTCDLSTPEGTEEYVKQVMKISIAEWLRGMNCNESGIDLLYSANVRQLPSTIIRLVQQTYGIASGSWGSEKDTIKLMKFFGFSKDEAKEFLLQNLTTSHEEGSFFTEEQLMKSRFGPLLENYDKPEEDKKKK